MKKEFERVERKVYKMVRKAINKFFYDPMELGEVDYPTGHASLRSGKIDDWASLVMLVGKWAIGIVTVVIGLVAASIIIYYILPK